MTEQHKKPTHKPATTKSGRTKTDQEEDALLDRLDQSALQPGTEPLTDAEKETILARVRARGGTLSAAEKEAVFGASKSQGPSQPDTQADLPNEMEAADLSPAELERLRHSFFSELNHVDNLPSLRLVQGIIFDFDYTLAHLTRSQDELMQEGARAAEDYMRSTGMDLPADFWSNIVEARLFAAEKSDEEQEEHIADDAMSFLLQFFGYPASKMDRQVLHRAVDLFYAPEMNAWRLYPGVLALLEQLQTAGYRLAVIANYSCDRVFQRIVDYLGIRPYLDVCIASASVEYRKPDKQIFQVALDRWDVLPYEVVIVGDSLVHDIQGGLELGALTIQTTMDTTAQVAYDNNQKTKRIVPDAVVSAPEQAPAIIDAWAYHE